MVTGLYFITLAASIITTIWFLFKNKKVESLYVIFCLLVVINSFGRYLLSISGSIRVALAANLFIYVGACYCPLMIILALQQLCGIRVSKIVRYIMLFFSTVVLLLASTIGKSGIYYKKVLLAYRNGYSFLIKTYGPAHKLFVVLMAAYGFLFIYYLLYAFRNRKTVSIRTVSIISIMGFAVMLTYLIERIIKSNISYLSVGYLIAAINMVFLLEKVNIYDLSSNLNDTMDRLRNYGYIEFDRKMHYISANSFAKELFSQIENEWHIDSDICDDGSYVYKEIVSWLRECVKNDVNINDMVKSIEYRDNYYDIDIKDIVYGRNKKAGYLVEIIDKTSERKYLNTIRNYNDNLKAEVAEKTASISHIKDMMVIGMATLVESRDNSTGGHIKRTSHVVDIFAAQLRVDEKWQQLTEDFLKMVVRAAPMHDLGKIAVPDSILQKQGKFTKEEYEIMKKHSAEGAKILHNILSGVESDDFVRVAVNVANYHHEKWDGSGYPAGISGNDIPVEARIMALADVFDALVSKRCYKEAYSYDKAFEIIQDSLGTHFDPELGRVFLQCRPQLEKYYEGEKQE